MQSLQQLYQIFEAAFPDIVSEPPLPIRASEDSKVGQFKGHKNAVGFLAGYSCSWMTRFCYGECYTERGQAGMDAAYRFRTKNTWALFAHLLAGDCEGLTQNFSTLIQKPVDQYHRRLAKAEDGRRKRKTCVGIGRQDVEMDVVGRFSRCYPCYGCARFDRHAS